MSRAFLMRCTANSRVYSFPVVVDRLSQNLSLWPEGNVSYSHWQWVLKQMSDVQWRSNKSWPATMFTLYFLGIIGSMMVFLMVHKNTTDWQIVFKFSMTVMAVADLVFSLLEIPYTCLAVLGQYHDYSQLMVYLIVAMLGTISCCSLVSDLFAVLLTFERYLCLTRPIDMHNVSAATKKRLCIVSLCMTISFSTVRLHQVFQKRFKPLSVNGTLTGRYVLTKDYKPDSVALIIWSVISDIVLPVVVTAVMVTMTSVNFLYLKKGLGWRSKVVPLVFSQPYEGNRRQQQVAIDRTRPQTAETSTAILPLPVSVSVSVATVRKCRWKRMQSMMSIMFLATVSLTVCQVSHVLWRIFWFFFPETLIVDVCSGRKAVVHSMLSIRRWAIAVATCYAMEAIGRTCNFYTYLLCSSSFRNDFKALLRTLLLRRADAQVFFISQR